MGTLDEELELQVLNTPWYSTVFPHLLTSLTGYVNFWNLKDLFHHGPPW